MGRPQVSDSAADSLGIMFYSSCMMFCPGGRGKLTLFDKYSMIMRLTTDNTFKQIHASKMYNISPAAVNQMVKRKERIIHDYEFGLNPFSKRVSCLKNDMKVLDERLMLFVVEKRREGCNVLNNTQLIWDRAEAIANELQLLENNGNGPNLWKPNRGWWFRFKNRVSSLVVPNLENDYFRCNDSFLEDSRCLELPLHVDNLQQYDFHLLDFAAANFLEMPACKRMCSYSDNCSSRAASLNDMNNTLLGNPDTFFDPEFAIDSVDHAVATGVCPTESY